MKNIDDRIRSALLNVSQSVIGEMAESVRAYDEALSKGLVRKTVYDIPLMRRISSSYDDRSKIKIAANAMGTFVDHS